MIVALGAYRESVEQEIIDLPLDTVVNPHWETGMSGSIRVGLEHLMARSDTQGAKRIMLDHAAQLVELPAPQAAQDIDTLTDYARLQHSELGLRGMQ